MTDILDREGTVDLTQRQASWRSEGWSGEFADAGPVPGSIAAADVSRAATYATPGVTPTGEAGGLGHARGGAAEPFGEDAGRAAAAVSRGVSDSSIPVSDYGASPRSAESDPESQRDRVRIYPGQI